MKVLKARALNRKEKCPSKIHLGAKIFEKHIVKPKISKRKYSRRTPQGKNNLADVILLKFLNRVNKGTSTKG